jgi:hypothetical protein
MTSPATKPSEPISLDQVRAEKKRTEEAPNGMLGMNPYILWGLLVVSIAVCAPIVFYYAPADWGVGRKVVGTVLIGALSHYSLFINRILVASW